MIYFAFQSTDHDALRATEIGRMGPVEFIEHNGMLFGIVLDPRANYKTRSHIDELDARLRTLPGPANGKLTQDHATHIAAAFPQAKKDDAMSAVLLAIYQATGHEGFNPNHH